MIDFLSVFKQSWRSIRTGSERMVLIFSSLIFCAFPILLFFGLDEFVLFLYAGAEEGSAWIALVDTVFTNALIAAAILLFLPTVLPLYRIAYAVWKGEKAHPAMLFDSFTSWKKYGRAFVSGLSYGWRALLLFALAIMGLTGLQHALDVGTPFLPLIGLFCLLLFLIALLFSGFGGNFLQIYLMLGGLSRKEARIAGKRRMRGRKIAVAVRMIPWAVLCLLSMLTVGVAFVLLLMPLMLVGYFVLADDICRQPLDA